MPETETHNHDHVNTNVGSEVLFENDRVRVWRLRLEPGATCEPHVHLNDHVFVYANPSHIRAFVEGQENSIRQPADEGFTFYREVGREGLDPHWITNEGDTVSIHYIVELLGPSRSETAQPPVHNNRVIPGHVTDW